MLVRWTFVSYLVRVDLLVGLSECAQLWRLVDRVG